jgi:hypothetical protein
LIRTSLNSREGITLSHGDEVETRGGRIGTLETTVLQH